MAWYCINRLSDGKPYQFGQDLTPADVPPDHILTTLPRKPDWNVDAWDGVTRTLISKVLKKEEITIKLISPLYDTWWMWRNTHAEAVARAIPAAAITAIKDKMDAAWSDYLNALNQWRTAVS